MTIANGMISTSVKSWKRRFTKYNEFPITSSTNKIIMFVCTYYLPMWFTYLFECNIVIPFQSQHSNIESNFTLVIK